VKRSDDMPDDTKDETELAPAGSLKQAPLWHEVAQLLDNPYHVICPNEDDSATPAVESAECTTMIPRRRSCN